MKNSELQDPLLWQVEVNKILVSQSPKRLLAPGILSDVEMEESFAAYQAGVSAEAFAQSVADRDRKVEKFQHWIESAPKNQRRVSA